MTIDKRLEFYMTLVHQLKDLDERFAIYILKYGMLQMKILKDNQINFLNEYIFNISKVETSLNYMYEAVLSVKSDEKRKNLLGQFIERVCSSKGGITRSDVLSQKCFFSEEDVDLVFEYF